MAQIKKETEKIWIKNKAEDNTVLAACFLPSKGMNFISFKKGDVELIDQTTKDLFEERFAGLGAMIGPHFHHRKENKIPKISDESLFPHIARIKKKGIKEPFSHGIGRYAPWQVVDMKENAIKARLKGDDIWQGYYLKDLEGMDFKMEYLAKMTTEGMEITLSVTSDAPSVVGLHTYYALPKGKAQLRSQVQKKCQEQGVIKEIDSSWNLQNGHELEFNLDREMDLGFLPYPNPKHGLIVLDTSKYFLQVQYWCDDEENSWQLWHKKEGSFVCIEPLSAKNPHAPKLQARHLKILLSIL